MTGDKVSMPEFEKGVAELGDESGVFEARFFVFCRETKLAFGPGNQKMALRA
jgi:hypothetical protein